MKTYLLALSETHLQMLLILMERVQLQGSEAENYLILRNAISLAKPIEEVQGEEATPPNRAARRRAAKNVTAD